MRRHGNAQPVSHPHNDIETDAFRACHDAFLSGLSGNFGQCRVRARTHACRPPSCSQDGGQPFLPGACNNPRQRALSYEPVEDQMFTTLLLITLCMTVYAFAMVAGDEG